MKKTKLISLMLAMTVFACMALGSGTTDSNANSDKKEIVSAGKESTESSATEVQGAAVKDEENKPLAPTIEEAVVYDAKDIVITAKEFSTDSIWGDGIKFLIENNSDKNITVSTNATIVNDFMIPDMFVASVAAGKKTNETLSLSSSELAAAGISNIGQIEVYFHIYDSDSWNNIDDTDCIAIKTSNYETMDTSADDSGQVLYEENGIKIVGKYVDENSFWGAAVTLYAENNSGRNITISVDNLSVNGFMVTSFFSSKVYDGKKAFDEITLMSSDLKENGITSVDEIALTFNIYDPDTYNTIVKTDEISFSTK